jgi:CheY-like chemotaxis protein
MQRAIKDAGYTCTTAENTQEALQVLEENSIDVVITDIVMPGPSGITLLERINVRLNLRKVNFHRAFSG